MCNIQLDDKADIDGDAVLVRIDGESVYIALDPSERDDHITLTVAQFNFVLRSVHAADVAKNAASDHLDAAA